MPDTAEKRASVDEVKRYWDARPCNVRHSPAAVGTRQYFDEVEARKYFVEPHIPGFAEFASWRGKRVLEIGCGIGTDAVNFARGGALYTGIELSERSLDITRRRFQVYGLKGTFICSNAEDPPPGLAGCEFDLVYSFGVIHHTPNPAAVVRNVHRLLAPGGEFRLMVYARNSWKNIMIRHGLDQPEAQGGCPIAFAYTPDEAQELLRDFRILTMTQDHIFPYVVEKYVNFEYEIQPWFRAMPGEMFEALQKVLGWHLLIRCVKR